MRKWQLVIPVCVGLVLLGAGGYFAYQKFFKKHPAPAVGEIKPVNPTFDMIHGKTIRATAASGGSVSIYDANKVGTLVEIPAGALEKDAEIKIIPIKKTGGDISGVAIFPENTRFKKPVGLTFDYSLSSFKNDKAPENAMGTDIRTSGSSHIYRYNTVSTSFVPQLVNRSTETKRMITAEVMSGGIYNYVLDDKKEVDRANYALSFKDQTVQTTLEAANSLFANHKTVTGDAKNLLKSAIVRVKANKTPDILELSAALAADKSLSKQRSFLIERAHADAYAGYLETICKDPSVGLDQVLSAWKTAQMAGYNSASENCKTRVQNDVAKRVNALLDQPDPSYVDLLKASQDVELVGLDDKFDAAIAKKRHDKAVREAQELLKDPSVDPRIIAIALQNMQLFVDDKPDLTQALQDRMNQGLNTDVQRVLSDPNATKQDIERALAKNDFTGGNEETKKKLEDKLKNAKDGPDAKVDETANQQVEEEMPAFDWATIGVAFLKMMGVEDFSEAGLKSWADQKAAEFEELKAYVLGVCAFDQAMGASIDCAGYESQLDSAIDQFKDGIDEQAEKVGAIQALPEDQVDNSYDGNNNESLTVSCISKEEAAQIDPQGKLGYTVCPDETGANGSPAEPDSGATDNSSSAESASGGASTNEAP